ncbi:MAG: preprotein translocase subunit SecG [Verrucomicrobia bacterium]|nr:preprotein translocase subunit SecG [Verrucomicrobiota bacterium]
MGFVIGFLTFLLVMDCLFLILLILIQLPKKEAGMGQAFGGAATDALFGAGSGTALTKLTKYATGFFLGMTLLLTVLNANQVKESDRGFEQQLNQAAKNLPVPPPTTPPAPPATNPIPAATLTNLPLTAPTNTAPAAPAPAPAPNTPTPPAAK